MSQKKLDAIKKARELIKSLNLPAGPMDEAVDYLLAEVERLRAEVERLWGELARDSAEVDRLKARGVVLDMLTAKPLLDFLEECIPDYDIFNLFLELRDAIEAANDN